MPKKILLADDSITIQKVVELTFSDGDYEVTAVNNGSRAIQKLTEMRPDIILSDIIMPEKNGYEVCEYVKSHPEYRNIPVVLLTGTFEPFDPDRADKAGCDAVVTKPFESQSLIHKVEELIEQSRANAPAVTAPAPVAAPEPPPAPAASAAPPEQETPWMDEGPSAPASPSPFSAPPSFAPSGDAFSQGSDIFGSSSAAPAAPTSELPFGSSPDAPSGGETRAFPKMSFDQLREDASTQQVPAQNSPWASEPAPGGGETRAFPRMTFDTPAPPPSDAAASDDSPFGAPPPAEEFSGETRAFPKMNFDDLQKSAEPPAPPAPPTSSLWDEQPPAFSGETRAFPKMSFDQLEQAAAPEPAWAPSAPAAPPTDQTRTDEFTAPLASPVSTPASSPFGSEEKESEPETSEEPAWAASSGPVAVPPPPPPAPAPSSPSAASNGSDLSDEQIDRIARRVVQLMSDQVVRNIAWEVIPDLAEMVVKERIRQLEAE